jgi:UDP-2,4-diacetamido-2,4,6-trideoxy-beta-L-altropyranose hydrolase
MKQITILTEGGENIGFGHLTRCLSLSQAFEAHGYSPRFIINGDNSVKSILNDRPFELFNWSSHEEKEQLFQVLEQSDAAIVDSYLADAGIYGEISKRVSVPLYLDDNKRLDYPAGIVLNWNIYAPDLDYPQKEGIEYLLGSSYISLRKAFWNVTVKETRQTVTDVMVTFGGDDSKNITPLVMRFLAAGYPWFKKHIIVGSAFLNHTELESIADDNTRLIHAPDAEGMNAVMRESDIAITSGGQTLYELACVGVPAVALAVADNQRNNVAAWEKKGFAENAGAWTDDYLMVSIADSFQRVLPFNRRKASLEAGRRTVPGNGAGKIVDFIEKKFDREASL